jgi:TatD DNase family protein
MIDSHTHLESFAARGDLDGALSRSVAAGVTRLITVGTSTDDWEVYRKMATDRPELIAFTAGLHPCAVEENWAQALAELPQYWQDGGLRPVALGECGLDRFHLPKKDESKADTLMGWQKAAFRAQLRLARELGAPVVVHSRGAFDECVELINESGVDWGKIVFHCFAEGPAEMSVLRELGGFASFTGILTYKSAESVREAAKVQGLDRLMIETDAPYLTPVPHRGKPNEPAYVRHTAEFAAEMFGVELEYLAEVTRANTIRFYGLE